MTREKPQYCSGRTDDGPCPWGPGVLQIWTVQSSRWDAIQQKSAMEMSVPDEVNFHNLVLRNSQYNRDR